MTERYHGRLQSGEDWTRLRSLCLGVAANGNSTADALRFIAAGRFWASLTDDSEAAEILGRRTLTGDGVAEALDACRHVDKPHGCILFG